MTKKQKMGYIIRVGNNADFEYNVDDEILVFETPEQIKEYAITNDINIDDLTVFVIELED